MTVHQSNAILPYVLPDDPDLRVQLIAIRRMAAQGLQDSSASWLMFRRFRLDARRRLVLLRTLVMELALASRRRIQLAPCCVPRMTEDERQMAYLLTAAQAVPERALHAARLLTGNGDITRLLSIAALMAQPGPRRSPPLHRPARPNA